MASCVVCSNSIIRGKYCKDCRTEEREKANACVVACRERNKEKFLEREREFRATHLESVRARDRVRYAKRREARLEEIRLYNLEHKEEKSTYDATYRVANEERLFKRFLKRIYGITLEQYMEMYSKQDGVCAICKRPEKAKHPNGKIKRLAVDHCHDTGIVRGLLCSTCNAGIGQLGDSIELLEKALDYLKAFSHFPH